MEKQNHDVTNLQVELVTADTDEVLQTEYAGVVTLQQLWQSVRVGKMLEQANIHYGDQPEAAEEMSFILSMQPWIRSQSQRRAAQRFGGESSTAQIETDPLLDSLLIGNYDQRIVNRFVNTARYDWTSFNRARVAELQQHAAWTVQRKGVIIVDDFPLPKPYAKNMAYLSSIWDNNLKRTVPGYSVVHLYYHHPHRPGYSLYVEPWLKTSAAGETVSKNGARRRARAGEERSKLDIALDALEVFQDVVSQVEAVVFDSWYTVRWFEHELSATGTPWIGDAKLSQKFQIGDHLLSTGEVFQCYRQRTRRVKKCGKKVRAVIISAVIPPDQYTKEPQQVQLVLVTGLTKKRDNDKGYHLLVTNQLTWTARHIIRLFSYRPVIEQEHRTGKQLAGWNDFHTRSLAALLCHLNLSLLRSTFLKFLSCLPALRDYSLAEFLEHGVAAVALLRRDAAQQTLQVLVPPDSLLLGVWETFLKCARDALCICDCLHPIPPGGV